MEQRNNNGIITGLLLACGGVWVLGLGGSGYGKGGGGGGMGTDPNHRYCDKASVWVGSWESGSGSSG